DDEIYEVEARIAQRREALPRVASDTGRSAVDVLVSPAGLAAAVAVGFLAGGGLRRRRRRPRKQETEPVKAGLGIGSLLMTAGLALVRAQFGSPAGMAQALLSRIPSRLPSGPAKTAVPVRGPERRPAPTAV